MPSTEATPSHSDEGQQIGPYYLLQKIGEGGMGEVWLAEQLEPVRRKVALKVVKQGMDTKWVVARFRILDAAAVAHRGEPVDWAGLAADLGYADQAHLTRAFTQVVGTPPETYRREA